MYDLSWLNPTPRAIAVYASQPLSPVATQHSLPSGRYSLLGPDFHRLDRTSFVLAHLFDHLIGDAEQRARRGETGHPTILDRQNWFHSAFCVAGATAATVAASSALLKLAKVAKDAATR